MKNRNQFNFVKMSQIVWRKKYIYSCFRNEISKVGSNFQSNENLCWESAKELYMRKSLYLLFHIMTWFDAQWDFA